MDGLPASVLVEIFSQLDLTDKCRCARVCRSWYHLMREKQLWKEVDFTPFRINLQSTWKIVRCYFTDALKTLKLQGFLHSVRNTECLSNAILADLSERCPNLEHLHIFRANLTKIDSSNLPSKLKILDLVSCQIPPGWFKGAVEQDRFSFLEVLDVTGCTRFCDQDLTDLALLPEGGKLRTLFLSSNYRVSHAGFTSMSEHLTNLTRLDVSGTNIQDEDMHFVCRNLKKLHWLELRNCEFLTDLCIGSLSTLPNLGSLDVRGYDMKLTGGALIELLPKLKELVYLGISLSPDISDADLDSITQINDKCEVRHDCMGYQTAPRTVCPDSPKLSKTHNSIKT